MADGGVPRCFLNSYSCQTDIAEGNVMRDPGYHLLTKVLDNNGGRRASALQLMKKGTVKKLLGSASDRRLTGDAGISWDSKYRYKDITFTNGGEFKLCFCDANATDGVCDEPEEFTIEVGRVHATGLQCLLSNPKMTKGTCVEQMYGGLRCYEGEAPEDDVPTAIAGVPDPDPETRTTLMANLIAFCQFAPMADIMVSEEVMTYCMQYRMYDPPPPLPEGGPIR
jgi:hypothetical protein